MWEGEEEKNVRHAVGRPSHAEHGPNGENKTSFVESEAKNRIADALTA